MIATAASRADRRFHPCSRAAEYTDSATVNSPYRGGVSALVSSQHLDEVARMADRILLLHHGQILGGLDPHGADVEHQFFQRLLQADRAEPRPR